LQLKSLLFYGIANLDPYSVVATSTRPNCIGRSHEFYPSACNVNKIILSH
jgi:hypothetical protein